MKKKFMKNSDTDRPKEPRTTQEQPMPSMSNYEADRLEAIQEAQDEWAESEEADASLEWAKRVLKQD